MSNLDKLIKELEHIALAKDGDISKADEILKNFLMEEIQKNVD